MTDITAWLKTLGLDGYAERFHAERIAWDQLPTLTEDDLRELGVAVLGDRKRLLGAIAALTSTQLETAAVDTLTPLIDALPTPLALLLRDFQQETHPVLKLWAACDTLEILLRLLVFLSIAELVQSGPLPDKLLQSLGDGIETPSLSTWESMANAAANRLSSDTLFPELRPTVKNDLNLLLEGPGGTPTPETGFRALRNQLAHGGGLSRKAAAILLARWEERLAAFWPRLSWLTEVKLLVCSSANDYGFLIGTAERPEAYSPPDPATRKILEDAFAQGEAVLACRGQHYIPLWPLTLYGVPRPPDPEQQSEDTPVSQIYVRRGEVRLQYTTLGDTIIPLAESDETALASFLELFLPAGRHRTRVNDFSVPDFEDDLRRDANGLIGRRAECDRLVKKLQETSAGLLWVDGVAGVGKSYLLAWVATECSRPSHDDAPKMLVLAYRFRASDERCRRETFLRFAAERLRAWLPAEDSAPGKIKSATDTKTMLKQLRHLLRLPANHRVLFILDGLDEITARDARFAAEVPLALAAPGVTWLCAGRPEGDLSEVFARARACRIFPEGLPPMQTGDIRTLLLERIGPLRKQLLRQDKEHGEQIDNPFVDKVARLAEGLPLYVKYVIDDIHAGRYRVLDAGERLPPGLAGYHEELLRRCAIGSLNQVVTPLAALLALAREPLSQEALADILHRRGRLVEAGESGARLVAQGLAAIATMLRRAPTPEGSEGYVLYHHSLAQQMAESPHSRAAVDTARSFLADLAANRPIGPAAPYLYRQGIAHLLDCGRVPDALVRLSDFGYLMTRLQTLGDPGGVAGIGADWRAVLGRQPELDRDQRLWEAFWREREHILRRGNARWPAAKILLQLAVEHGDDSPVTRAAETCLEDGHCDWVWLRNPRRVAHAVPDPCLGVLEGHTDSVTGALILSNGRILSWSNDGTLRLWDGEHGVPLAILEGHAGSIGGVQTLPDGRLLSWSDDGTLRLWDVENGAPLAILEGHTDRIGGVQALSDGRLLSWSDDGTLHLWDGQTGAPLAILMGQTGVSRGVVELSHGRLLSWSDDPVLRLWDGQTGALIATLEGHSERIHEVRVLSDGHLLSWSRDAARLWDDQTELPVATLEGHTDSIMGVRVLADGRLLSWSADGTLRLWDGQTGALLLILEGHTDGIMGVRVLADGRLLSWSDDGTLRLWDGQTGALLSTLEGHSARIRGVRVLSDGRLLSWSWDGTLRLWDGKTGDPLANLEGHTNILGFQELSNGRLLSWSMDTLRLRDGETGGLLAILKGHTNFIVNIQELSDGRLLSWSWDGTLRIWDGQADASSTNLEGHADGVIGVRVLADGRLLSWSSGNNGTLRLWDGQTGAPLLTLEGEVSHIRDVLELLDGRVLAWPHWFDSPPCLWDGQTGALIAILEGHTDEIRGIRGLSDGRLLSWTDDGTLRLWDGKTGALLATLDGHTGRIAEVRMLSDERMLSWSWNAVRLWDQQKGVLVATLEGHTDRIGGLQALSDGHLLSWSDDRTLRLWDGQTGAPLALLEGHIDAVKGGRQLSDGRLLSWSADGTVRLWDGLTGASLAVLEGHTGVVMGVKELSGGRLLSWSSDETLRLWDGLTGGLLSILEGHIDKVKDVLELSDGRLLFWSGDNNILRLWDGQTGAGLASLEGHTGWVEEVREFADGRLLSWSSCFDGIGHTGLEQEQPWDLHLWDVESGSQIAQAKNREDLPWQCPDLLWRYLTIKAPTSVQGSTAVTSFGFTAVLATKMPTISPVCWQAASAVQTYCLSTSGIFTVTLASGHLFCLHLYRGNRRITLTDYESAISNNATDKSVHLERTQAKGINSKANASR